MDSSANRQKASSCGDQASPTQGVFPEIGGPVIYVDIPFRMPAREGQAFRVGAKHGHHWCHMWSDDVAALHVMALKIGMKRAWFQDKPGFPHYDLVPARRAMASNLGRWNALFGIIFAPAADRRRLLEPKMSIFHQRHVGVSGLFGRLILWALFALVVWRVLLALAAFLFWCFLGLLVLSAVTAAVFLCIRSYRRRRSASGALSTARCGSTGGVWTVSRIEGALGEIDWFQFEKFCAALLAREGFSVSRQGGAQPDGGVDLIATKGGRSMLIQCKHWRTWLVQLNVIRELLGSMTHFRTPQGGLYTLKGWTQPAEAFAREHGIELVSGRMLAARAAYSLNGSELDSLLLSRDHHCPKCEALMLSRSSGSESFLGCSRYPRCDGVLKNVGAQ